MIYSSAPLRVTFAGGGSDYKSFYEAYGGAIFGSAIDKRVHVFINPLSKFSTEKIRFTYRITESVDKVDHIEHPVVREALRYFEISDLINIATMADIPGNTGLGSSSAFTVALVSGLARYKGVNLDRLSIAKISYYIERELIGEAGGIQDHLQAAFGGMRLYNLQKSGISVSNSLLDNNVMNYRIAVDNMFLLRIGKERFSQDVAKITGRPNKKSIKSLENTATTAMKSFKLFEKSIDSNEKLQILKDTINENWLDKQTFQESNHLKHQNVINQMRAFGVDALKICGAGESGFLLILGKKQILNNIEKSSLLDQIMKFQFEQDGVVIKTLH